MGPSIYSMEPNGDDGDEVFDNFDLWMGLEGSCEVRMLGRSIELRAGRVVLIPSGVRARQCTGPNQKLLMMYAHFDCMVGGQPVRDASRYVDPARLELTLPGLPTLCLTAEVDTARISEEFYRIRAKPRNDLSELMLSIAILEIVAHLREAHLGVACSLAEERLERVTTFLEQNLHRQLSLAEMARHACVSPETLGRLFRAHYQVSPMRHLTQRRMARARELLQIRRYNISETALACGYASLQYFCRAFRKEFGVSPGVFRKRLPLIP
jgi:AraC-like DNA-binding protein